MAVGLVGIITMDRLPWPAPAIILVRDLVAIAAFVVLARRGVTLHVDMAGKVSSTVAMVAVGLALGIDATWVDAFFWFAAALSVATFANYARTVRRRISAST
jgi:phosphatidylglycerophosphate synthase